MPISLRMPPDKEQLIVKAARRAGKSKTGFILDALDEKLQLVQNRERVIRMAAGWLSPEEASELRKEIEVFEELHEGDWQ
jgi:uncharacterized protein (DUF1778 family)